MQPASGTVITVFSLGNDKFCKILRPVLGIHKKNIKGNSRIRGEKKYV